ncbi:FAD-dependent oxidoreductase [Myceligenerans xiligouense]|uniref:2-polyprenyl-6-methoxyphenol hydroxylase-like FAD-dependent oxidoreductase n=1 Tax=Myceligenerans xiligouense TaxID=253184 RepID=A0A3N4YK65_9MICO|nr:FAD-dependent oxidoreductase [Myceligenerans xiligouense]RPF21133.1 2-polyprenyl-6-methoxyphenol hydroxylase-like FAD-dependent oxidoreductase [Myceligenerans xiligouense]
MTTDTDVVVVGAGPTGLLLAGDLAAAGVRTTLVERRSRQISNLSRAFAVHARALEQLDAREIAEPIIAGGQVIRNLRLLNRFALDLGVLPSRFPQVVAVPQYEVERVLLERAEAEGVRFTYDSELEGLDQDADGVSLRVTGPDGDRTLRARYVVGCDGHHSAVRDAIGLPFPGRAVIRSMVLADVRLAEPPSDVLTVAVRNESFCFIAPFGDGYHRVIGWRYGRDVPEDTPLDLDEVRETMRAAFATDFGMIDARWTSRFHSDERQAPHYRVGRVFVAGDAAHVHSPAGGQGMNTGLQDAANLSWKLAQVVSGTVSGAAAEVLLDSYEAERHPVGTMVLRASGALVRAARGKGFVARALGVLVVGVVGNLPPARRRAMGMISGIGISYRRPRGAHRLVGLRAPDIPLFPEESGGVTRLYEALRSGGFVVVRGAADGGVGAVPADPPPGSQYARWAADAVQVRRADGERTTVLVRPDGYVAWAG